jgi:MFS family permease
LTFVGASLGPLTSREFRLLFVGRTVSFAGSAMAVVALAFAVLEVTGSKTDLGLVLAARAVPQIVFLLAGGIWSDRLPRHHVLVVSNLVSGLTQAAVALLLVLETAEIWHLVALAAVNGTATAFFFPASQGLIPQTVAAEQLQQANALLRLALNASWIGGAAAGGFLVHAAGPGVALAIDAGTFFVGAAVVAAMRFPATLTLETRSFFADLRAGWHEFSSRRWLWAIVLQFSLVNAMVSGAFTVLGPVVAESELGGARDWGLILAAQSTGMIAGGLLVLRYRPRRLLTVATLGVVLTPVVLVALGFPLALPLVLVAAAVAGVGIETFGVLWDTTMQQEIAGDMLSRVYSYDALGSFALIPVGLAAAGPIADVAGVRPTLFGAAAIVLLVTLAVFSLREVRELERRVTPSRSPANASP